MNFHTGSEAGRPISQDGGVSTTGGDSLIPSAIMISAAVVNAILDPILILGLWGFPRLELVGAAWVSNGVRAITLLAEIGSRGRDLECRIHSRLHCHCCR